jgi:putative tricarboxylic transport membrane protein
MVAKVTVRLATLFDNADKKAAAVVGLIAMIALFEARDLPFGSVRAPDSGFFPKALSALLLLFSFCIYCRAWFDEVPRINFGRETLKVAIAALALCAYALSLNYLGFVIATVLILLLMMKGFGGMSLKFAGPIALASVLISYAGFVQLGVPLPQGPLPF